MPNVNCHKTLVVLLMLVFSSQLLASGHSFCQNINPTAQFSEPVIHTQPVHAQMMDHSQHMDLNSVASADCCNSCDCSLGGCSTTAVLPAAETLFAFNVVLLTSHYHQRVDDPLSLSFLRPPISR